ncbi:uncharacterized protein LOC106399014 [Brassica napus]|uniref:uncharacterized protein LOC106399014 n=1 Tax=Brassica napus TaxID=3708 RepID=UPI0006AB62B9|nr:uncharacterized protein LOC106399014 [Brassica napus]
MVDIITKDLLLAYKEDELFLKQKSRDKWLVFGDRSSKFFHDYVKTNRSKNQLLKLKDKNNKDQWSDGAKAEVAVGYFSEHFISSNPSSYEPAFASFLPRVSGEMNKQLTRQISKDEVTHAIFSICADSALGPDGMTAAFFKIIGGFWEIKLPQRYRKSSDQSGVELLEKFVGCFGFDNRVVQWVMMCVTTVTYSVLINDHPFGLITPQRGIRQGDPQSPFLFVLCTEGLTHLLNVVERNDLLDGMQFASDGPSIHHLLFANDSMFMCKASHDQATVLNRILQYYGKTTDGEETRAQVRVIMGIDNEGGTSRYLGLPECFSGSKVDMLSFIKDRSQARLDSWYLRQISQGEKEILLKSTVGGMPVFAMSVFRLPKTVTAKISSMMANYWWGDDSNKRKIH